MTETQFLLVLSQTRGGYKWQVQDNNIVGVAKNGKARGEKFDPLTAVCRSTGNGSFGYNRRGKKKAANKLNVPSVLASNVINACKAASNRGNYQVLRGRIRQVLDV